jgi:hypothetical protein
VNRLDETFLFERSIDIDINARHADCVRQQMTLLKIDGLANRSSDRKREVHLRSPTKVADNLRLNSERTVEAKFQEARMAIIPVPHENGR